MKKNLREITSLIENEDLSIKEVENLLKVATEKRVQLKEEEAKKPENLILQLELRLHSMKVDTEALAMKVNRVVSQLDSCRSVSQELMKRIEKLEGIGD